MENINGKRIKIKEYATQFTHEGITKELIQYEVITPDHVRSFTYVILNGKVTCV